MYKTPHARSTFWSSDVEKLHAAVAKSTFPSQNAKKLTMSEHFLEFWCAKLHAAVARSTFWSQNVKNWRCRSTTFWSSDVEELHAGKLTVSEHFLKFWCAKIARRCGAKQISKWKCSKHLMLGALFEVLVRKNCTPLWRSTFPSQNAGKLTVSEHFLKFRCRVAQSEQRHGRQACDESWRLRDIEYWVASRTVTICIVCILSYLYIYICISSS